MASDSLIGRSPGRPASFDDYVIRRTGDAQRDKSVTRVPLRTRGAWLLRVNRLYGASEEWRNLTSFSGELRNRLLIQQSPATVSRWERGQSAFPFAAVRGYESVLELQPYSLVAVLDTVFRYHGPTGVALPWLRRGRCEAHVAGETTREILYRVVSDEPLAGSDWDDLSVLAAAHPRTMATIRADWWAQATHRLLLESMISDGVSWMLRFEALNRFLTAPLIGPAAVDAVRSAVDDRQVQSLVGTASLFDASASPEASAHVLRYLRGAEDDRIFKGAMMACVRKIRFGHFHAAELENISRVVADAADSGGMDLNEETRALAVSVLGQIPAAFQHARGQRVLRAAGSQRDRISLVGDNRLVSAEIAATVARRVADHAASHVSHAGEQFVDPVLPLLIEEALFDPVFDARLYANSLIYATPYRQWVAQALTAELSAARRNGDALMLTTLYESLRKLGGPRERALIEATVLEPGTPTAATDTAAYALGHVGGSSDDLFWSRALELHTAGWAKSASTVSASVLDRLVYAIGMANGRGVLRSVCEARGIPPKVKESALWWLGHPPSLMASRKCIVR